MFRNHIKIAWRNLTKNRGLTLINVMGLSIGIAACLLITIYILHETSYDSQIANSQNIYRLYGVFNFDGAIKKGAHFSANNASTLAQDFEEIEMAGRLMDNPLFYGAGSNDIRLEGDPTQHHEDGFAYADQSLAEILDLRLTFGTLAEALTKPKSILISDRVSKKYFNHDNPIGKTLYLNNKVDDPFTISGVMADFPTNSHLDYDFFITLTDVEFGTGEQTRWLQSNYINYFQLKPGTDILSLEKKMTDDILTNYMIPAMKERGLVQAETIKDQASLKLQPLSDIHLHSTDIFDSRTRGDVRFIWLFGFVALFILLIACINFINLSTAKSANRAKEVGLRKVLGSKRSDLIRQFLTESTIIAALSILTGVILAYVFLPIFNNMADKRLLLPLDAPFFWIVLFGSVLTIGLLAGIYPSIFLSAFEPMRVLKGKLRQGAKSSGLRSGLVIFQFTISIILIVATLIVNQQLHFILSKKVGFEKDQVLQLHSTNVLGDQIETFKNELKQMPQVLNASISDYLPVEGSKRNGNSFWNEGRENLDERVAGQAWIVDEDYLSTLGISLLEGRNFAKNRQDENSSVIINQKMAKDLGLEDPVGKKLTRGGDRIYNIIGIVENFHFETFREEVRPLCLFAGISPSIVSVKINTADLTQLLQTLENKWNEFNPNLEFRYTFLDQSFAAMYSDVRRIGLVFTSFATLAIFIACLGLFALSAFMVEQRSKEMSIRKVLGASLSQIFKILTQHFVMLVIISLVIATPVAFYLTQKWLEDYSYRIDLSWQVFALAGLSALLVALATISYHALRTALVNPISNLRDE